MCDLSLTELHFFFSFFLSFFLFFFFLTKPAWMQNTAGFNSSHSLQPAGPEKNKKKKQLFSTL